jgi:LmbE family N-acetylglucosaminyl deacetylase
MLVILLARKKGLAVYLGTADSLEKQIALFNNKRLLLVAAHPDDIESGCGGTVAKYSECNTVHSIVFAPCLEDPLNAGVLEEFQRSMKVLGVKKTIRQNFARQVLEQSSPQIRNILYDVKSKFDPNIVFCPSLNDLHQDHRAVANCCHTIFRDSATLLAYEVVRSTVDFSPNLYVSLSDENMKRKLKALQCYKTQYRRGYFKPSVFKALARLRGSQVNVEFAEAFEIIRMVDK